MKIVFLSAKLEKGDSSGNKSGGETAKLVTLTKAIDAIQENSKSLETMGNFDDNFVNIDNTLIQSRR